MIKSVFFLVTTFLVILHFHSCKSTTKKEISYMSDETFGARDSRRRRPNSDNPPGTENQSPADISEMKNLIFQYMPKTAIEIDRNLDNFYHKILNAEALLNQLPLQNTDQEKLGALILEINSWNKTIAQLPGALRYRAYRQLVKLIGEDRWGNYKRNLDFSLNRQFASIFEDLNFSCGSVLSSVMHKIKSYFSDDDWNQIMNAYDRIAWADSIFPLTLDESFNFADNINTNKYLLYNENWRVKMKPSFSYMLSLIQFNMMARMETEQYKRILNDFNSVIKEKMSNDLARDALNNIQIPALRYDNVGNYICEYQLKIFQRHLPLHDIHAYPSTNHEINMNQKSKKTEERLRDFLKLVLYNIPRNIKKDTNLINHDLKEFYKKKMNEFEIIPSFTNSLHQLSALYLLINIWSKNREHIIFRLWKRLDEFRPRGSSDWNKVKYKLEDDIYNQMSNFFATDIFTEIENQMYKQIKENISFDAMRKLRLILVNNEESIRYKFKDLTGAFTHSLKFQVKNDLFKFHGALIYESDILKTKIDKTKIDMVLRYMTTSYSLPSIAMLFSSDFRLLVETLSQFMVTKAEITEDQAKNILENIKKTFPESEEVNYLVETQLDVLKRYLPN